MILDEYICLVESIRRSNRIESNWKQSKWVKLNVANPAAAISHTWISLNIENGDEFSIECGCSTKWHGCINALWEALAKALLLTMIYIYRYRHSNSFASNMELAYGWRRHTKTVISIQFTIDTHTHGYHHPTDRAASSEKLSNIQAMRSILFKKNNNHLTGVRYLVWSKRQFVRSIWAWCMAFVK